MDFLTKLSLKKPVSLCLAVLALLVFGLSSLIGASMELIPDINMPMLVLMGFYPGASPEDVESLVTVHLESAASTLPSVKNINCISSENVAMVMLEFEYGTNMEDVKSDLRGNLEIYKNFLPEEVASPTIVEMRTDMTPTMVLSATSKSDLDLYAYVDEYIVPQIKKVDGVANVDVMGGDRKYISVTLREDKLEQYNLSMDTIAAIVKNADFSFPAGSVSQGNVELLLRGGVDYETIYSLGTIPIALKTGDVIHLSDVADIVLTVSSADSISKTDGVDDVTISISKRQSSSTFDVTDGVKKVVENNNSQNLGVDLGILNDSSKMIKTSISSVFQTMFWGIILAMAVLFIFFGDWKASVIVGTSIPVSLLVTLIAMQMAGFSFNILSIGGLVVGIGMMVDNSIVVIESCFRNTGSGSLKDAAIKGTSAVSSSIFASTLTTVVVFLPIAFIKGMSGQLFGQLCFTIVFSLLASLISAVSIVPLMYYKTAPKEKEHSKVKTLLSKVEEGYMTLLPKTLKKKRTILAFSFLLLVFSCMLLPFVGVELMPQTDEGTVILSVSTRSGLKPQAVEEILKPVINTIESHEDVEKYSMTIGDGGMMSMFSGNDNSATINVYLKENRQLSTSEFVEYMRKETADLVNCKIKVDSQSTTGMMSGGTMIDIPLRGSDYNKLVEASQMVEEHMNKNPDIISVSSSVTSGNPQAEIDIDPIKAGAVGIIPAQAMGSVRNMMVGVDAGTLKQNGRDYSINVEYPKDRFKTVSDLESMMLVNPAGMKVPLKDISEITYSSSPVNIVKENGQYIVTVSGQPSLDPPAHLARKINSDVLKLDLPYGVSVSRSMQMDRMYEEFSALLTAILTAAFLVFLVMAMQFESPRFSLVVMMCVPFSLIGSFIFLFIFRKTLSLPSLMGFLMLVGTVVNNGILFIDTTERLRQDEGFAIEGALAKAGAMRLRPILMTTLTTALAMIPMAVGAGENGAIMQGMAMVIIGGLTASTIMAMLVLPSFYILVDKNDRRARREKRQEKKQLKEAKKEKVNN